MNDTNRPSVLIFFLDQLSAKWVEAAKQGIAPLPNLKRLKECGITFRNAITSNPVCCPTRATVATGLTTRGHGVLENRCQLDPALVSAFPTPAPAYLALHYAVSRHSL